MELQLDRNKRYTYADYLTWTDNKMRELLDGFIKIMSPAPTLTHARLTRKISYPMIRHIDKRKGKCEVFVAPFDVRLPKSKDVMDNDKIDTVVQPDICIVCDPAKLDKRGCLGAPDMIVEILSPATLKYDLNEKFNLYEAVGVKEYWVVSPAMGVNVFLLQENGKYGEGVAYEDPDDQIPVHTLDGLNISWKELFAE
ncbi:MAG: Uma2 family endonuclease [Mediterranea sp.]|jgi:Uma2 family endonuclease|nr:Uma2 family endonuclease [Mediterranea sp.]